MAKTSGGTRKVGRPKTESIKPFKESEKAIQIEMLYQSRVSAFGGVSSQFGGDWKDGKAMVWVPKNQIENGNLSEWIAKQKSKEISDRFNNSHFNSQLVVSNTSFFDANGKKINVAPSKKEREWQKERDDKRKAALDKATKERDDLIEKAKANGYKAHSRMKTSTLMRMAKGTYQSKK